ncbi:MAG TPA: dihydrofolate reductase [Candidatus Saccharimonadales bacterium]|jgi:dihydrofolate reductase
MKTFIIAAITADGFIGRTSDQNSTDWTNPEDKYLFTQYVKRANNMVMGLNTFLTTARRFPGVFNKTMPGRRLLVYTHHPEAVAEYQNVEAVSEPPQELVQRLEREGVQALAVCGGAQIYTMFMQAGVVDDLYIDVVATVFGSGIGLFNATLDTQIALEDTKRLGDNNILLHYTVVR